MASETERQRFFFFWLLECGRVTVFVLRRRGRVSRSNATENTYTPARRKTLFKLSAGRIHSKIRAIWGVPVNEILDWHVLNLVRDIVCRNPSYSRKYKSVSFSED